MESLNRLRQLHEWGQSPWYDYINRDLICSGTLKRLIDEDGLSGITSNPAIFEKAIGEGTGYDDLLDPMADQPIPVKALYEALAIRDIQEAADLLLPVYEKTNAHDGYVSLEVSPDLAYDTEGTIGEALRLFKVVGRPNVMIKIPGTGESLPAIERLIYEGVNINVTLLFSVRRYEEAAAAYIAGLQKRVQAGRDIRRIASVASFFVSRIDTAVDAQLEAAAAQTADPALQERYKAIMGKAAIANAKIAYCAFQKITQSQPFLSLHEKQGALPQRLLWASTSTKNKAYPETYYVDALIGKETVNTMPAPTFEVFRGHGQLSNSLADWEDAPKTLAQLADCGIDLDAITQQLTTDGIRLFSEAFDRLMAAIYKKRRNRLGYAGLLSESLGQAAPRVTDRRTRIANDRVIPRFWRKDETLWRHDAPLMLGWIDSIEGALDRTSALKEFAQSLRGLFKHAVLIGIGGSSLCPKGLAEIFGKQPGFPELHVLDTVLPASIQSLINTIPLEETVFIIASKSGSTIEPTVLCEHMMDRMTQIRGEKAGDHFIAITDPGSQLLKYAQKKRFRKIFEGIADIGGRYSALSPFGMVPAAIMGVDIEALLHQAQKMRLLCDPHAPGADNPSACLGAAIGQCALEGKDKLTFIASPAVLPFAFWLEQLIAESTGKNNMGIIPIVEEPERDPSSYAQDRTFVYLRHDAQYDTHVAALEKSGHPVIHVAIGDLSEIGGQFLLWEMATAVMGVILNINPFDQPNVEESKKNTRALLERTGSNLLKTEEKQTIMDAGIAIYVNPPVQGLSSLKEMLAHALEILRPNDYVALNAYLPRTAEIHQALQALRSVLMEKRPVATTLGYGPAYLHSSGQLHKGGPDSGVFWIITSEMQNDIPIPERPYTFGQLAMAQAIGDFQALRQHQRRVLHIHLPTDALKGLHRLHEAMR